MNDLKFREEPAVRPAKTFRLDRQNAKALGVCSGIARWAGVDPMVIRAGFVLGTLVGFGSFVLIYLAIALIAD